MAGNFTTQMRAKILNHIFGGVEYVIPDTYYLGLSTTTIATNGSNISEPSGNGYSRVAIQNDTSVFPLTIATNSANVSKNNGTSFEFPTATGPWGTITDYFITDSPTGFSGLIFMYSPLSTSKAITADMTPKFNPYDITITM